MIFHGNTILDQRVLHLVIERAGFMVMDQQKIRQLAVEFETVASKYGYDPSVDMLMKSMEEIVENAKSGSITDVIEYVPGSYYFQEKGLSKYSDLESSYSKLKLALITEKKQYDDLKEWAEKRKRELFGKK